MAERNKTKPPSRSAAQLPPLKTSSKQEDDIASSRNRIMFIHNEMEELHGQRQNIASKLRKLDELEQAEHIEYLHLVSLKKQRKDLEAQSLAVSNRIDHLKNLKDDLWKRIRYMHSCAHEIEVLKKKNEARRREKDQAKTVNDKTRDQKGALGSRDRETRKLHISRRKELMEYQKKEKAEKLRQEREENERKYKRFKMKQIKENELKRKEVHTTEIYCTQFKELFQKQKREKVLKRLGDDKKKEKFIIKKFKREIDDLRKREDDWMAEVRETEKMFFKANDRLKKVMNIEDDNNPVPDDDDEITVNMNREELPDDEDDHNQLLNHEKLRDNDENSNREGSGNGISVD